MAANPYREFLVEDDCVLLLVDIQETMLNLCENGDKVVNNARALIEIAQLHDIPIIFSEHNAEKLGGFMPALVERVANPVVLNKTEFSCLDNRAMAEVLLNTGRRTLLVAGIEAHVCVFRSAAHALRLGYRVHVAADAVTSRSRLNWEVGLRRLEAAGGVVSSTEMIIFELLKEAGTERFRQALPLLKTL